MVLWLKPWKSRTSPGIAADVRSKRNPFTKLEAGSDAGLLLFLRPLKRRRAMVDAGWSSPVARQAHNLKVVGSNPTPATNAGNTFTGFGLRLHSFLSFMKCTTDKDKLSIA